MENWSFKSEHCFNFKESFNWTYCELLQWSMVTFCRKAVHVMEITPNNKTGIIKVDIWEQYIPMIQEGHIYQISRMQVRLWDWKKETKYNFLFSCNWNPGLITHPTVSQDQIKADDPSPVEITVHIPNIYFFSTPGADNCSKQLCKKLSEQSPEGQTINLTVF